MSDDSIDGTGSHEMLEPVEGLRLERPAEPRELRAHLRDSSLAQDTAEGPSYQGCFGAWLWERWRAALEPAGVQREAFTDIVAGYRRELWLWLLGERGWEPLLSGLAGRVARRLPAG